MTASWRELAKLSSVELKVIAVEASPSCGSAFLSDQICNGIDIEIVPNKECMRDSVVLRTIQDFKPQVIVTAGWIYHSYRRACIQASQNGVKIIMTMDTPWRGRIKQHFTRLRYLKFLNCVDHALVASDLAETYAEKLGFPSYRISRKLYAWDESLSRHIANSPRPSQQRGWLFVGRYEEQKGIDMLVKAYVSYRERVAQPWDLHCCGMGSLERRLTNQSGIVNHGFVQPTELPSIYAHCRVFLFPSTFEPWGVALVEAMGCGLIAIASKECGAARELIRQSENGLLINANSVDDLSNAMVCLHNSSEEKLNRMSEFAKEATIPYQALNWANDFWKLVVELGVDSK